MIVEELCPKCGGVLVNEVICTYPPIPAKWCPNCHWRWEGEMEEIVRKTFVPSEEEKSIDITGGNNTITIHSDNNTVSLKSGGDYGNITLSVSDELNAPTKAVKCHICGNAIFTRPISDTTIYPDVFCNECRKRLKELLYPEPIGELITAW